MKQRGFSLIEVMIVLALITLIASFVFMNISVLLKTTTQCALQELRATLYYMQYQAYTEHKPIKLLLDIENNTYSCKGETHSLIKPLRFGVMKEVKGPPTHPTVYLTKPITFKNDSITFHPQGIMESGTVYLIDERSNVLYALTCGVSVVSFLRVYRYDKSWKLIL